MSEQSPSASSPGNGKALSSRRIPRDQAAALLRSATFGDIIAILMRAPKHRKMSLESLSTFILPALTHNQILIAKARAKDGKAGVPSAGIALWASVSDEVDQRLKSSQGKPLQLAPGEWSNGNHLWLIDLVAPAQLAPSILRDIEAKVAKGRTMSAQIVSKNGEARITTLQTLIQDLSKAAA